MDTYMHKIMVSVRSLEKIEIIRSQEFMPSEVTLKFLKKMIILGPKTPILGPQFWCWGLIFGGQGGLGPWGPLDLPLHNLSEITVIKSNKSQFIAIVLFMNL